jgi:4-hydroxyacetophenone monooxygenase
MTLSSEASKVAFGANGGVPSEEGGPKSDAFIAAALSEAVLPPLLPALAHATGDMSLLREDLRPDGARFLLPDGGLTPEQQRGVRELAFGAIRDMRDGTASRRSSGAGDEALLQMAEFLVGGSGMEAYVPIFKSELGHEPQYGRSIRRLRERAGNRGFHVAIVGAGMSGLLAAHHLSEAGVPFIIYEKNASVGGTWMKNTYPGCRVDVPNHLYSYSFAQEWTWSHHYSAQDELQAYFEWFADRFGLTPNIELGATVEKLTWIEDRQVWRIDWRRDAGTVNTSFAQAVISAVGQLNHPYVPDFPNSGGFAGPAFHSGVWDDNVDLDGKRVAVIGTGASACQLIPAIAPRVGVLKVFQRTPPWFVPTPDYQDRISDGLRWLFDNIPHYAAWHRCWWFWRTGDGVLPSVRIDSQWKADDVSISAMNQAAMLSFARYIARQCEGRPDLLEKSVPAYPVGAKRGLRDDGSWFSALKRSNVELISDPIEQMTPEGPKTADGRLHEMDVIIYGTGFTATEFLHSIEVTGRDGVDLHEKWDGWARAFIGMTVPSFPNLFLLYGPNTNVVVNGSIIFQSECEVNYVLELISTLLEDDLTAVECHPEVYESFSEKMDAENRRMAWSLAEVHNWYKNKDGRVTQNWPLSLLEFWEMTRQPEEAQFLRVKR